MAICYVYSLFTKNSTLWDSTSNKFTQDAITVGRNWHFKILRDKNRGYYSDITGIN